VRREVRCQDTAGWAAVITGMHDCPVAQNRGDR